MISTINYRSISSQSIISAAKELWLHTNILSHEHNLYTISSSQQKYLFKNTDFGGNTALAYKIANDKILSNYILDYYGYPIAKSYDIYQSDYKNLTQEKITHLQYPLVIKPIDQAHGNGVMMNIINYNELIQKLWKSFKSYPRMMIQEQIKWKEYRVLIVKDEVLIVENRTPPYVKGDGVSTTKKLIKEENKNPHRWNGYMQPLSDIIIDNELIDCITKQWYNIDTILNNQIKIELRGNSNTGTWWGSVDCTHLIHKDTKDMLIRLSHTLWFEMCGIDIITTNISLPLWDVWWIILELNATPGIWWYKELLGYDISNAILQKLFIL